MLPVVAKKDFDISCESPAGQMIHMKYQALFPYKIKHFTNLL